MRLYSSTLNGLSNIGWHKSVAGIVGFVTKVGEGMSNLSLLKNPVLPPYNCNLLPIASTCNSGGKFLQYCPSFSIRYDDVEFLPSANNAFSGSLQSSNDHCSRFQSQQPTCSAIS